MPFSTRAINMLHAIVDWFIPPELAADRETRKQARLFLISHLLGPFLGNAVPIALYVIDPAPGYEVAVLAISICSFWIFPPLLRVLGRHYNTLALISIQNLIFCILWSCYFYGGVTSPTLPWVLTIPLLSFFYIGPSPTMRLAVLGLFAVNFTMFCLIYFSGPHPKVAIPISALQALGLTSTAAASCYVIMMALFYARALASQTEMEAEMRGHLVTATELRRAATEAERASVAKAEFVARMSHELRTPLNAVIGYSQMLLEEVDEKASPDYAADLERIHTAGQHLLRLVNDILDLSKIEAGKMDVYNERFSVAELAGACVTAARHRAREQNNVVLLECGAGAGDIVCDYSKLQHVLDEILGNANKFTSCGHIYVTVERDHDKHGEFVRIAVRDTGVGIPAAQMARIFQQFSGHDDSSTSKYGGTGLGLALSQKLCRLMGGDITVESETDVGSCFTVIVPTEPLALATSSSIGGDESAAHETGGPPANLPPQVAANVATAA